MLRRLTTLLAIAACALAAAACSGEDGARAQELLAEMAAAEARTVSATFEGTLAIEAAGRTMSIRLDGGGYTRGENAGDMYMRISSSGLPSPLAGTLVRRGGTMTIDLGGVRQSVPTGPYKASSGGVAALAGLNLAAIVERVSVEEAQTLNGEPVAVVQGAIDTGRLLEELSRLDDTADLPDGALDELGKHVGETSGVLYISERTHLLVAAVVKLALTVEGETAELRFTYRLKDVNRPIRFPL